MQNSNQAMFYACDYSTKPNMVVARLLVAIRSGLQCLEEELKEQDAAAQQPDQTFSPTTSSVARKRTSLTKLEDEARRRLIRQATAANQAIVKGNCSMVMQMLTGREVSRTPVPW